MSISFTILYRTIQADVNNVARLLHVSESHLFLQWCLPKTCSFVHSVDISEQKIVWHKYLFSGKKTVNATNCYIIIYCTLQPHNAGYNPRYSYPLGYLRRHTSLQSISPAILLLSLRNGSKQTHNLPHKLDQRRFLTGIAKRRNNQTEI